MYNVPAGLFASVLPEGSLVKVHAHRRENGVGPLPRLSHVVTEVMRWIRGHSSARMRPRPRESPAGLLEICHLCRTPLSATDEHYGYANRTLCATCCWSITESGGV